MQTVWTFLVYFWLLGGGSSYPSPQTPLAYGPASVLQSFIYTRKHDLILTTGRKWSLARRLKQGVARKSCTRCGKTK